MDAPDHTIGSLIINRVTGIPLFASNSNQFFRINVKRERDHFGARHHDLSCTEIRERENPVNHLLFVLFQYPRLRAGCHQHLELVLRMHQAMARRGLETQGLDSEIPGSIEKPNEWTEKSKEGFRGFNHKKGCLFGILQSDRLGS